jgi:hypothetical protein
MPGDSKHTSQKRGYTRAPYVKGSDSTPFYVEECKGNMITHFYQSILKYRSINSARLKGPSWCDSLAIEKV